MNIFDFAEGLNGREYGNEITPFEEQRAKELGFVVVFGYSDDNAEFRGAYEEEIGCYDGGRVYEDADKYIDAIWCEGEYSWAYKTNIPHATFDIYEDGEKYCKGIVFQLYQREGDADMKTNRQWLESLTDKQLASFLTEGLFVTSAHHSGGIHFPVNIRMTANSYAQSNLGIEKWLSMPQDYIVVEKQNNKQMK